MTIRALNNIKHIYVVYSGEKNALISTEDVPGGYILFFSFVPKIPLISLSGLSVTILQILKPSDRAAIDLR